MMMIQRFSQPAVERQDGVEFHFVQDTLPHHLRPWHTPRTADQYIAARRPDIVHLNGSMLFFRGMRRVLDAKVRLVWQHHGGAPPPPPQRFLLRWPHRTVDAFFFTALEQAEEWRSARLIHPSQPVYQILEGSSPFRPIQNQQARRLLGLGTHELFLWVGRLNRNKDPITVLRGFYDIVHHCVSPLLIMVYSDNALLPEVNDTISYLGLRPYVLMVGRVPHTQLRFYYSAADYFILGSHHEGSGYALLEALSCGTVPIVTDIPSFRNITNNGHVGGLWRPGDSESFVSAFLAARSKGLDRRTIRTHFEKYLSYDVLGRDALSYYEEISRIRRVSR